MLQSSLAKQQNDAGKLLTIFEQATIFDNPKM